jgi:hypothetical protein
MRAAGAGARGRCSVDLARGRPSSTVKKKRAALNSFLRWLVEFEHIPAAQARAVLAIKLPRTEVCDEERGRRREVIDDDADRA